MSKSVIVSVDFVKFTKEILDGKLNFLCSDTLLYETLVYINNCLSNIIFHFEYGNMLHCCCRFLPSTSNKNVIFQNVYIQNPNHMAELCETLKSKGKMILS